MLAGAALWGGLESPEDQRSPRLQWTWAVEGWAPLSQLEEQAQRMVNEDRRRLGADPWQAWHLVHVREVDNLGRREVWAEVFSARRGIVGTVTLVFPSEEDLMPEAI